MDHPEVQGGALPYSTSYNISSFLSISRFMNRFRKGSSLLDPSATPVDLSEASSVLLSSSTSSMAEAAWPTAFPERVMEMAMKENLKEQGSYEFPSFPNPWGFFTSGYVVGLVIVVILLHRMQNVVIPSSRRNRNSRRNFQHRTTLLERFHSMILPLDFSRTSTRFIFHLPSIYFLLKMLTIWVLLVFQTCEVQLTFGGASEKNGAYAGLIQGRIEKLGRWANDKEMTQICWSTFLAGCGAFWIEGLVKALDGLGSGSFPGGMTNLSPFHLVTYAFMLHIYSSPFTHTFHPADNSPPRPDKHVVSTIAIAVFQIFIFHILSISKRHSTNRLVPTGLTSFLSLVHFHTTIYFHFAKAPPTSTRIPTRSQSLNSYLAACATLNCVPNLFETVLLGTIFLTVTFNAIAQLLVRGRIDHVFSGLGFFNDLPNDDGTRNGFLANLPYDEDFIIVLLRIGVASLEATGLRGWNNEVAPIQRPVMRRRRMWASRNGLNAEDSKAETYGSIRIGRLGVAQVQQGSIFSARASGVALRQSGTNDSQLGAGRSKTCTPRQQRGFYNDVREIDLGHGNTRRRLSGLWYRSIVGFWQFFVVFCGVIRGLVRWLLDRLRKRVGDSRRERKIVRGDLEVERDADEDDSMEMDSVVYQRFLRGEDISDDEEEAEEAEDSSIASDEETTDETEDEGRYRYKEVLDLFDDFLRQSREDLSDRTTPHRSSTSDGEIALAHMLHGTSRPFTRKFWNALQLRERFASTSESDLFDGSQAVDNSSMMTEGDAEEGDRDKGLEHVCVVCMLEQREIICWPCRCLTMCDGCREALALRTCTSKHRCPCCRQVVDGYSKIYIP